MTMKLMKLASRDAVIFNKSICCSTDPAERRDATLRRHPAEPGSAAGWKSMEAANRKKSGTMLEHVV